VGGAADLPHVAKVAESDVIGGVEVLVGAQIPLGKGAKRLVHVGQALGVG
jgi:hypothetical protein